MPKLLRYSFDRKTLTEIESFANVISETTKLATKFSVEIDPIQTDEHCEWDNWNYAKGVTSLNSGTTVVSIAEEFHPGLHGEMLQSFGIDPVPLCYDTKNFINGFLDFVRFVLFADPNTSTAILGVDFSLSCHKKAGVINEVVDVCQLCRYLIKLGLPIETNVVLLNCRMKEYISNSEMREDALITTINDFSTADDRLSDNPYCHSCGFETFGDQNFEYCFLCGAKRKVGYHVLGNS